MQAFVGSDSAKLPRNYTILRHDDAQLLSSSVSLTFVRFYYFKRFFT